MNRLNEFSRGALIATALAAVLAAAVTATATTVRQPDSSAVSSATALNTTMGDCDVSPEGKLDTMPLGFIMFVR